MDSIDTPELDTSLDEPDAITSSVSSGSLHSISTISDNSKLHLAPRFRSCTWWCQGRALFAPVPLAIKISASKVTHYFSSHPSAFGFLPSTPSDNITLSSTSRKADQSLSKFQISIGAPAYATLDREQLISCLRVALVDNLSSLLNSKGRVIPVSKVCELFIKVHDILDNAVSK